MRAAIALFVVMVLGGVSGCTAADPVDEGDNNGANTQKYNLTGYYLIEATIDFAIAGIPENQRVQNLYLTAHVLHDNTGLSGELYWNYSGSQWIVKPLSNVSYKGDKITYTVKGFTFPQSKFPDLLTADMTLDIYVNGTIKSADEAVGNATYDIKQAQTKVGTISNVLQGNYLVHRDLDPQASDYPPGKLAASSL